MTKSLRIAAAVGVAVVVFPATVVVTGFLVTVAFRLLGVIATESFQLVVLAGILFVGCVATRSVYRLIVAKAGVAGLEAGSGRPAV